jgi:hypothetical protein
MRPGRAASLALVLLALGAGCSSTDEVDENRFELFRENSRNYYDRGAYTQALHQANMALTIEPEDDTARLIKAFCLIKIGNATDNPILLDDSLRLFEQLLSTSEGRDDFRASLGLGSACLARSFEHDREIARVTRRLKSDFLSASARKQDEEIIEVEQAARVARLRQGEAALRRVLAQPLEKDNAYAMVDLVLTLNALGGRDAEALELAVKALEQLDASTYYTQTLIQKNAKISATAKVDLEQRIANNREKEVMLRDLVATVHYNAGDMDGFFKQLAILEERKLMGEVQYYNRAEVHEQLGDFGAAADDLDRFLRLRVQRLSYEQDEMAPEVFQRIETLRARHAEALAQTPR